MGTRSVIAVPLEGHRHPDAPRFRGRYVHWDGYPEGVGVAVAEVIARDGLTTAVETLIKEHYGWSSVNAGDSTENRDPARFVNVPGYGLAYMNDTEQPNESRDSDDGDNWDIEYAYVIRADATVEAYRNEGHANPNAVGEWSYLGTVTTAGLQEPAALPPLIVAVDAGTGKPALPAG